ncbi:30S ribosomal protein S15 [Patescibacteria group bacterium]|nr:30S ribosomal protein S15 [Patescibacteria group bacterium]
MVKKAKKEEKKVKEKEASLKKEEVIKDFQKTPQDTGSAEVQIGLLGKEIKELAEHLKKHIHDFSARRSLVQKVSQRRKFIQYLKIHDSESYEKILKKIKRK